MENFNHKKLQEIIKAYKDYFPGNISHEIYKWKAVKCFQDNWDIDAKDFTAMLKEALSKTKNLLSSHMHFPRRMILAFSKIDQEFVRNMFRNLYDEHQDLAIRMETFAAQAKEFAYINFPEENHYQNYNAISTYLWLRYPEEYFIYKYSEASRFCELIDSPIIIRRKADTESVLNAFGLYLEIASELRNDSDILYMVKRNLTADCYSDYNRHCAVTDLVFFASRFYAKDKWSIAGKKVHDMPVTKPDKVQPSLERKCGYWWLCANPKIWSIASWPVGTEQDYTLYNSNGNKRRIFQNFIDAKAGDKVICYEATPTKQITGLATISEAQDGKRIFFKKTETLTFPIDYSTIKEYKELQNMEFFANPNGSFFKLTEDEYRCILDIIRDYNIEAGKSGDYESYSKEDFLKDVYMSENCLDRLEALLKNKKNIIIQGAPGVGKTFSAKRLAYKMMGCRDESRICLVQFHQNYSYEDFIMGYKPSGEGFELQRGLFYKFCINAANNPKKDYFFIIDEINRGNLSKIFGELLMLIEKDYRGESLTLAYKDEKFFVPKNLYIIGMMNTADRSLAIIDYALRRRFSFYKLKPGFESEGFTSYMNKLNNPHLDKLVEVILELNRHICNDDSLGEGFEIGHSYFCGQTEVTDELLSSIIDYDLIPMLEEYWFDNKNEVKVWSERLNNSLND